jgi:hypothetical protein
VRTGSGRRGALAFVRLAHGRYAEVRQLKAVRPGRRTITANYRAQMRAGLERRVSLVAQLGSTGARRMRGKRVPWLLASLPATQVLGSQEPMRPRGLEPPRTNQSTRPSTLCRACRCFQGHPDRPNCEFPWTHWTKWTQWMLSRVLSQRRSSSPVRAGPDWLSAVRVEARSSGHDRATAVISRATGQDKRRRTVRALST